MSKLFWCNNRIKVLSSVTTEAELYGADTIYGYGETILEFTDGSMELEKKCFELSISNLVRSLRSFSMSKNREKNSTTIESEIDFYD